MNHDSERAATIQRTDDQPRGVPASGGLVTGRARIIHGRATAAVLQPGDIAVCATATLAWSLFSVAAGIITERGGQLSSLATVAREYGIPTVVALNGATTRIRDGQIISMDGGTGMICLRDEDQHPPGRP